MVGAAPAATDDGRDERRRAPSGRARPRSRPGARASLLHRDARLEKTQARPAAERRPPQEDPAPASRIQTYTPQEDPGPTRLKKTQTYTPQEDPGTASRDLHASRRPRYGQPRPYTPQEDPTASRDPKTPPQEDPTPPQEDPGTASRKTKKTQVRPAADPNAKKTRPERQEDPGTASRKTKKTQVPRPRRPRYGQPRSGGGGAGAGARVPSAPPSTSNGSRGRSRSSNGGRLHRRRTRPLSAASDGRSNARPGLVPSRASATCARLSRPMAGRGRDGCAG
jgi:hypothetical protein